MKGDYGFYVRDVFFKKTTLDIESIVLLSKLIAVQIYSPKYVIYQNHLMEFMRMDIVQLDLHLCELLKRDLLDDFVWDGKKLKFTLNKKKISEICEGNIFKDEWLYASDNTKQDKE